MSRGEGSGEVGYATLLLNNTPKTTHGHKRSQGNFTTRDVYRPYSLVPDPGPSTWRNYESINYESIKRKLNKRLIYECRCDERRKAKAEGSRIFFLKKIVVYYESLKREL